MEILKKIYNITIDTLQTILLAASIFLVIYIFLFRPFQVSGDSMFPTYKNKEYILTSLISLRLHEPDRGDVIVFHAPTDSQKDFIKRVIAVPKDSVYIKEGFVYVNGNKINENAYLKPDVRTHGGSFMKEDQPVIVPTDNYIVMGDNRSFSSDSREWGFLPETKIIGVSLFVYWPITNMRLIKNPY